MINFEDLGKKLISFLKQKFNQTNFSKLEINFKRYSIMFLSCYDENVEVEKRQRINIEVKFYVLENWLKEEEARQQEEIKKNNEAFDGILDELE